MNLHTIFNAFSEFHDRPLSNGPIDVVDSQSLSKAYLAHLGRPPNQSELSLYANVPLAKAISDIAASPEARSQFLSDRTGPLDEQVTGVYTNLFGRQAGAQELNYWIGQLQAGSLSPDQLALVVLNGAQGNDAQVIANKLEVIDSFTRQLTANSDFAAAYVGDSATNTLRGFLSHVGPDDASVDIALSLVQTAIDFIIANKDAPKAGGSLSIDNSEGLAGLFNVQLSSFASTTMTEVSGLDDFLADSRFSSFTGKGQAIAIVDSSFDLDHPAFGPDANGDGVGDRILYHADFTSERNGANNINPADKHGTHVASIVAGQLSEARGIAPGANLILLQALAETGYGTNGALQQALQWVVSNAGFYNIVAVNNSWGSDSNDNVSSNTYFGDEFAALVRLGVVPLVAAGNSYEDYQVQGVGSPADDTFALGVSSSNGSRRLLSEFSQRSETLSDIVAPGSNILSARAGGGTIALSGTSMASPVAAGAVALAQEIAQTTLGRRLTVDEVYSVLQSSASRFVDSEVASDGVTNSGGTFRHLNIKAMGEAVVALGSGTPAPNPPVKPVPEPPVDSVDGGDGNDVIEDGDGDGETYLDDFESASLIFAGQTISGELELSKKRDFFAVDLEVDKVYEIALAGVTLMDPYLRLFNADGSLLGENDDGGDGLDSALNVLIPETGRYYVAAESYLSSDAGTYSLAISDGDDSDGETHRDDFESASLIFAGQTISGELEFFGEPDFFAVDLVADKVYEIALTGVTLMDPYLRVFNADGSLLGENDDGDDGLDSALSVLIPETGRYYVAADSYLSSEAGTYSLAVSSGAELKGGLRMFSITSSDRVVPGEIAHGGALNGYSIELSAGMLYTFSLRGADSGVGTLIDPYLELFLNDQLIEFNDDSVGRDSQINFIPAASGTYTLVVSHYSLTESGSYILQIDREDYNGAPDVPGNLSTQASLVDSSSLSGEINFQLDEDWFRVDLQAGNQYSFALTGLSDSLLKLFDGSGVFVSFDDDGGDANDSLLRFVPTSDGTYYISAGGYAETDIGPYSLSMSSQVATEDIVSAARHVGPLTLGSPVNGVLGDEEGYDVYTITLSPGDYRLSVQPGSGANPLADPLVFIDDDKFFLDGLFDDDGGTGPHSLAEFSIAESIDAVIAVGGYDPGSYALLIQSI